MNIVGEQFARLALTLDQNGAGMTWFNGAGSGTLIYTPSMVIALVRAQKILGAEVRLALHTSTRLSFSMINVSMGPSPLVVTLFLFLSSYFVLPLCIFSSRLCKCPHCDCLLAPMPSF
jgi:hypothetical protein